MGSDTFQQLMEQASRNSVRAQQSALEKEKERRAAEEDKARQRQLKERREQEFIAQRKRERQLEDERRRREEEKRKLELPKTRNLHELNEERKKRGISPVPAGTSRTTATSKEVETKQEREQRRRRELFKDDKRDSSPVSGGMALAKAMQQRQKPLPKLARPIDGMVRTSSLPARMQPSTASTSMSRLSSNGSSNASLPKKTSSKKASGKKKVPAFDATQFKALNTEKRDLRTIEEIERDMRERKKKAASGSAAAVAASSTLTPPKSNRKRPGSPSSSTSSSSAASSEIDDNRYRRPKGKTKGLSDDVRNEIWSILGRGRQRPPSSYDDDDGSDGDMEATGADLEMEERRAERIAIREDRQELEALERHAQAKRKRLANKS